MITNLTKDWERVKRESKLKKFNEQFYMKLQLGLIQQKNSELTIDYSDRITLSEFFDSDGNVKK